VLIGAVLPFTPFADSLGLVPLPLGFCPLLVLLIGGYMVLTLDHQTLVRAPL